MQARARKNTGNVKAVNVRDRIDQAIVWITLAALFLVPLTFSFFNITAAFSDLRLLTLHLLAGLVLILWTWRIALEYLAPNYSNQPAGSWDLFAWTGRNPARWAIVAVGALVIVQVASTLLSPLPVISFYGGDEARTGYNLYDSLSMLVLFFSVARRFRSQKHLELLAYTLIASGTVAAAYGIAQHFGWDPIGGNAGRTRVIASFGNTLNFAAYMVMTIPATLAMVYHRKSAERWWFPILAITLALQIAGIWFAGGRGPFVGAAAGLIVFFVIAVILLDLRTLAKSVAMAVAASIIAAIIIALPSAQGDIAFERISSIGEQLQGGASTTSTEIGGGLAGRFQIWGSSLELVTTWPAPVEEPFATRMLRPVFGLGPDMLIYSYPFVGKPQTKLASVDHAHNYPIQILAEQGYAGFLLLVGASILLVISAIKIVMFLRNRSSEIQRWQLLVLVLLPATAGKLTELQTGVSRISDLTMTFAIMAGVLVLYELIVNHASTEETEALNNSKRAIKAPPREMLVGASLLAALVVTVTMISLFVTWDVRRVTASRILATTYDSPDDAVRAQGWIDSQARAPERETLTFSLADAYLTQADQAESRGETEIAIQFAEVARDLLLAYEKIDPFEWDVQMALAKITSRLVTWGEVQYGQEMADRYRKTADLYPSYPSIVGTAATALTSVGLHELAIHYADQAISMEATTKPWAKAWYAKGRALFELGREEEAIAALTTATEKQPGWEAALLAHQVLSEIYRIQGNEELEAFHKAEGAGEILFTEE